MITININIIIIVIVGNHSCCSVSSSSIITTTTSAAAAAAAMSSYHHGGVLEGLTLTSIYCLLSLACLIDTTTTTSIEVMVKWKLIIDVVETAPQGRF